MTTDENNRFKHTIETNSDRYGNTTTIEDVYDNPAYPKPQELADALAATDFLTDKESFAFVHGHIEGIHHAPHGSIEAEEIVQRHGFDTLDEFKSAKQTAKDKIADAIWIYELIDAYRLPEFASLEKCDDCGDILGHTWVGNKHEDELTVQCMDCADTDPDSQRHPYDSPSDTEQ